MRVLAGAAGRINLSQRGWQRRHVRASQYGILALAASAATLSWTSSPRPRSEHAAGEVAAFAGVQRAGLSLQSMHAAYRVSRAAGGVSNTGAFPTLAVFDLDACLWDKEMFELYDIPGEGDTVMGPLGDAGEGVVGAVSGSRVIGLHPGGLQALQDYEAGRCGDMRIGVASSADTPRAVEIGTAALRLLEVVPGKTVWEVLMSSFGDDRAVKIGRSPPLSSDKSATHFPLIRAATGIRYDEMLFFDDCGWGDHCGKVEMRCREGDSRKGPVTVRTPQGLRPADWAEGLQKWRRRVATSS